MNAPEQLGEYQIPLADLERIDRVADSFEAAWKRQPPPPALDDYLAGPNVDGNLSLLHELVRIDLQYRERTGNPLPLEQYARRFPALLQPDGSLSPELLDGRRQDSSRVGASTIDYRQGKNDSPGPLPAAISRYRIVARLGEGTQGEVFRAFDPDLNRDVAIKLGKKRLVEDPVARERFLNEARAMALANHPNLVRVYDHGTHDDRPYLVTEFVNGCSLAEWRRRPLPPREAAALVARVARGLAEVHRRHMTHQDLKPANVLIDDRGQPRIVDFGLARRRSPWSPETGPSGGTPAYMAPEQAREETDLVGPISDIFGAGGILFFLLTGAAPFADKDVNRGLARARRGDVDRTALARARVPRRLEAICLRALAPEPADRYPQAEDLALDLERFVRRPGRTLLAAAALVLAVAGLACWLSWPSNPPPEPPALRQPLVEVLERRADGKDHVFTPRTVQQVQALAPFKQGERLVLRCDVPRGYSAGVFCVGASGRVRELAPLQSNSVRDHEQVRFPAVGSWKIEGPPGTLFLLVCADRRRKPEQKEVEQALQGNENGPRDWPALPPSVILLMHREDVEPFADEIPRGHGPEATAFARVSQRLERWRGRLRPRFDYFWGIAVPQR